ncbi:SDR family NAD(P)-dependent oxidoreductase [Sphingopyxis sp. MSC1_008]|jgi:NAD(P)-dependent dehydrogenase (short-subunit alcohol dehydrogenase family)|uniref:SDR family NAD(P)-dependent oxidoreductase n=1 Tax=Sphingopyxis sp. MSC1_008 TaxID=2909265 RepID=UPI0020BFF896|nr:SDR family NAD(P)-dependent oxidoreductase [Sphingopyxis sp. MSC1_008]
MTADLASRDGVEALFDAVDGELGALDMLVGCAALGAEPIHEMREDAWRTGVDTNLAGCLGCARATAHASAAHRSQVSESGKVRRYGARRDLGDRYQDHPCEPSAPPQQINPVRRGALV